MRLRLKVRCNWCSSSRHFWFLTIRDRQLNCREVQGFRIITLVSGTIITSWEIPLKHYFTLYRTIMKCRQREIPCTRHIARLILKVHWTRLPLSSSVQGKEIRQCKILTDRILTLSRIYRRVISSTHITISAIKAKVLHWWEEIYRDLSWENKCSSNITRGLVRSLSRRDLIQMERRGTLILLISRPFRVMLRCIIKSSSKMDRLRKETIRIWIDTATPKGQQVIRLWDNQEWSCLLGYKV